MPQMSPLMWLILMIIFLNYMYLTMTQIYFLFKYHPNLTENKKFHTVMNLKW